MANYKYPINNVLANGENINIQYQMDCVLEAQDSPSKKVTSRHQRLKKHLVSCNNSVLMVSASQN
jgi:hypothetical protein